MKVLNDDKVGVAALMVIGGARFTQDELVSAVAAHEGVLFIQPQGHFSSAIEDVVPCAAIENIVAATAFELVISPCATGPADSFRPRLSATISVCYILAVEFKPCVYNLRDLPGKVWWFLDLVPGRCSRIYTVW